MSSQDATQVEVVSGLSALYPLIEQRRDSLPRDLNDELESDSDESIIGDIRTGWVRRRLQVHVLSCCRVSAQFYGTLERETRGPLLLQLTTPTFSASVLDATSTTSSVMTPRPVIAVPAPLTLIRLDGFVIYIQIFVIRFFISHSPRRNRVDTTLHVLHLA